MKRKMNFWGTTALVILLFAAYYGIVRFWASQKTLVPWTQATLARESESENENESEDDGEEGDDDNMSVKDSKVTVGGVDVKGGGVTVTTTPISAGVSSRTSTPAVISAPASSQAPYLKDLSSKIAESEKQLLAARDSGAYVEKSFANLDLARTKLQQAQALSSTKAEEAQQLAQEGLDLATAAPNLTVSLDEVGTRLDTVGRRLKQAKSKLALLDVAGGKSDQFATQIDALQTEFDSVQTNIRVRGADSAAAYDDLATLEEKVMDTKSALEEALYRQGGSDPHVADDITNESKDITSQLERIASRAGERSADIERKARLEQLATEGMVEDIKTLQSRSALKQSLFGPDLIALNHLSDLLQINQSTIQKMDDVTNLLTNPQDKQDMMRAADDMKRLNEKLSIFVESLKSQRSLFGWIQRYFSSGSGVPPAGWE